MQRTELRIDGMSCGHCVQAVRRALEGLEGVNVESVEIGTARIVFESGRVREEEIRSAVADEGFTVRGREALG